MNALQRRLTKLQACPEAVAWAADYPSLAAGWKACQRSDWLLWYLHQIGADRRLLVTLACNCAAHVLPIWTKKYPDDDRPANAIRVSRQWTRGRGTQRGPQRGTRKASGRLAWSAA